MDAIQRAYFEEAEVARFRWTTSAPGFAETEDELLAPIASQLESPLLEIGCGEGNNLVRFAETLRCTGADLFPKKLAFASRELPDCHFVSADGASLPFAAGCFASIFVRDLLHHVPDPRRILAEVSRVLRPGGCLWLLEPNGRNPLIWLQTRVVPAEAGARGFSPSVVQGFFEGLPFTSPQVTLRQPLPLRRALLHYQKGVPFLGRSRLARRLVAASEQVLGSLLPRSRWTYIQIQARRHSR
jgi:ubiquinone/menaquinone biosynthesis C-methylase UbiE